jgi:heme/copper-type cytochrome/quinol oxidase subunit 2
MFMRLTRRSLGFVLLGTSACLLVGPAVMRLLAHSSVEGQEQAPNRRDFTIVAKNYEFSPSRIEVMQDDLVKITLRSGDEAHSFTIDGYRIMKRVPAGGSTTFEFRADRTGTFPFYCGMTSSEGHTRMKGELVVASR